MREDKTNGLGKMLKVLRKQRRMTQAELAFEVYMERSSIANIETGRQTLTVQTINTIAGALGYTVHVTFRRKKP
jgi:transcriptional regulator with XRE-family HTH domain